MKNDAFAGGRRVSVEPTLLVTLVGIVDDVRKAVSTDFLEPGDLLYVAGGTSGSLGASILERALGSGERSAAIIRALSGSRAPAEHMSVYRAIARAISGKIVRSCHDLSDGGLAVAVAESCLGGRLGAELRLDALPGRASGPFLVGSSPQVASPPCPRRRAPLFAEDPGRLLLSIRSEDRERFERMATGLRRPG